MANAVGGQYKQDYGTIEGLKNKVATDPVGFASDLSMLFSGGAAATAKVPGLGKTLANAAAYTNPAAPITKAAEFAIGRGAVAAGNVIDTIQGERAARKAGNIVRNALTEEGRSPQNIALSQNALRNAAPGTTVRQALSDVTSPQIQYLGASIEGQTSPGAAMATRRAEEAGRMQRMQAITPDEAASLSARTAAAEPLYSAATQPSTLVNTAPLIQQIDTLTAQNPGNTKLISALQQVKTGLEASTDAQQVSSVLDNLKDLIASKDNKFVVRNLKDVKNSVESALPGYSAAQQAFAAASPPVNQSRLLGAMQETLQQPLGVGERAGAFANALGRGENALIKRSTGDPRFVGISDILTPDQLKVVKGVETELLRNANVAAQTKAGAEAMQIIMDANKTKVRLPDFLSVKITLANQMLRILEGRLNKQVMSELEKGFSTAKSFEELMNKIPASERITVLRALGEAKDQLSPAKLNALSQVQEAQSDNALAP